MGRAGFPDSQVKPIECHTDEAISAALRLSRSALCLPSSVLCPAIAARCRFRDCHHHAEPGCAINMSLDDGPLEFARWQSYQKLQREQAYAARREDPRPERETRNDWKKIDKQARAIIRMKRGDW